MMNTLWCPNRHFFLKVLWHTYMFEILKHNTFLLFRSISDTRYSCCIYNVSYNWKHLFASVCLVISKTTDFTLKNPVLKPSRSSIYIIRNMEYPDQYSGIYEYNFPWHKYSYKRIAIWAINKFYVISLSIRPVLIA